MEEYPVVEIQKMEMVVSLDRRQDIEYEEIDRSSNSQSAK